MCRTDALVERVWGKVGAARPDDCSRLWVGFHLGKAAGSAGVLEDGAVHAVEDVDLAAQSVGEGQPKDAVADDLCGGDVGGQTVHRMA
jgi:hypothetical protein